MCEPESTPEVIFDMFCDDIRFLVGHGGSYHTQGEKNRQQGEEDC